MTIIIAALITLAVLGIGGAATTVDAWYWALRKPTWNPPDWLFGPAWTLILALAAWAGVLAWTRAAPADHPTILLLFLCNIVLHMLWSPLFFNLKRPDWALIEVPFLWASIVALMLGLARYGQACVWLLVPYLLWVGFAAYLNLTIVRLNASFRRNASAEQSQTR